MNYNYVSLPFTTFNYYLLDEEVSGLAMAVTNWLVQVETLSDIIDRA